MLQEREQFAAHLRTEFLDRREDVEVSVTGVGGRILELRYAGFGDVYLHHFRKQTTLAEIRAAGFHTVTMTDGYEWKVTLDP